MGSASESTLLTNLLQWVNNFPIFCSESRASVEDFKDGEILSKILKEDVDPEYFGNHVKISSNGVTPLVALCKAMKDYIQLQVGGSVPQSVMPNITKLVSSSSRHNNKEITKVLRMLLICAVHSPYREKYVEYIMGMGMREQEELMSGIKEVLDLTLNAEDDYSMQTYSEEPTEIIPTNGLASNALINVDDLQNQLTEMCNKTQYMTEEISNLKSKLSASELEYYNIAAELSSKEDKFKLKIKQVHEKNTQLEEDLEEAKKLITSMNTVNSKLKSQLQKLQASETKNLAKLKFSEARIQHLQESLDKTIQQIGEMKGEKMQIQKTFQKYIKESKQQDQESYAERIAALEERIQELLHCNSNLSKVIETYADNNQHNTNKNDTFSSLDQAFSEEPDSDNNDMVNESLRSEIRLSEVNNQEIIEEEWAWVSKIKKSIPVQTEDIVTLSKGTCMETEVPRQSKRKTFLYFTWIFLLFIGIIVIFIRLSKSFLDDMIFGLVDPVDAAYIATKYGHFEHTSHPII